MASFLIWLLFLAFLIWLLFSFTWRKRGLRITTILPRYILVSLFTQQENASYQGWIEMSASAFVSLSLPPFTLPSPFLPSSLCPSYPLFLSEWLMDTFGNNCPHSIASGLYTRDHVLIIGCGFSCMSQTPKLTVDYTRQMFLSSSWKNLEWYSISSLLICQGLRLLCLFALPSYSPRWLQPAGMGKGRTGVCPLRA